MTHRGATADGDQTDGRTALAAADDRAASTAGSGRRDVTGLLRAVTFTLARRIVSTVGVLLIVSIVIFLLVRLAPGDPASSLAGPEATAAQLQAIHHRLGLDDPLVVQYWHWLYAVLHGSLGTSLSGSQSVGHAILSRAPLTLSLVVLAMLIAIVVAVPAGVLVALRPGTATDRIVSASASLGIAIPNFLVGLFLIYLFALKVKWFPATGYVSFQTSPSQWLEHLVLPSIALASTMAAELTRHVRSAMLNTLQRDYVRSARAKGLSGFSVVMKHAAKPGAIPVVTVVGLQVAQLIGGTIIVEQVFALPGLGSLGVQAVFNRDYPMIEGFAFAIVVVVLVANTLVDLSYSYLNPRLRAQGGR
jgi:peptide/nickel transport system permease protein